MIVTRANQLHGVYRSMGFCTHSGKFVFVRNNTYVFVRYDLSSDISKAIDHSRRTISDIIMSEVMWDNLTSEFIASHGNEILRYLWKISGYHTLRNQYKIEPGDIGAVAVSTMGDTHYRIPVVIPSHEVPIEEIECFPHGSE